MYGKMLHDTIEIIVRGSAFFILFGFGEGWARFGLCLLAAFLWSWADNINKMHK